MSFSSCEAALGTSGNQITLEASEQAAAQGITLTVSSGDNGSAGCDNFDTQTQASHGFGVNGFASTPYAIAVGGTDFDVLSTSFATYVSTITSGTAPYYPTSIRTNKLQGRVQTMRTLAARRFLLIPLCRSRSSHFAW